MYKVSGLLFPDNFSSSKKTSFLLDVLSVFNFHSDETLIAKRSSASIYLFYLFYCLTCCSITQHRSSSMAKIHSIPQLFAGSFAVEIRDHLRSRVICGPFWGLLAVWGSFAVPYTNRDTVSVKFWSFYLHWRKILGHFNMIKKLYLENNYERRFFDRTFYLCLL